MGKSILNKDKSYTFSDYFELSYPTKDIVAEFEYKYVLTKLSLPKGMLEGGLARLRETFYKKLPHISLNSETARREVMIAPVLLELLDYVDMNIDIEYPLYVNEYLKGNIDYFLSSAENFIVVEAKKADMERGFSQLAVELIALDKYKETEYKSNRIYGAVTMGDIWRFGALERETKVIYKDIDSFRVPSDIESLFAVFIGILGNKEIYGV